MDPSTPVALTPPRAGRIAFVLGAVVIALFAAGCDLMTLQVTPRPSRLVATPVPNPTLAPTGSDEAPTLRPEPSGSGPDLVAAADALADLDSYRVTVRSRGLVPAVSEGGTVTMTSTLVQGESPAAEFTMTGVDGFRDGRLQAIVVGDEAWLREGTGAWQKSPGGAADFDAAFTTLSPRDLVAGFEALSQVIVAAGSGRKNGQAATRYRAAAGDAGADAAGLTAGSIDVWLSDADGHLVSLAIDGTWDVEDVPTPVLLAIDVTRVNDPANRVTAP
jgi:hypothetical protein